MEALVMLNTGYGPVHFETGTPKSCCLFLRINAKDDHQYILSSKIRTTLSEITIVDNVTIGLEAEFWNQLNEFERRHLGRDSLSERTNEHSQQLLQRETELGLAIYDAFLFGEIEAALQNFYELLIRGEISSLHLVISSPLPQILNIPFEIIQPRFLLRESNKTPLVLSHPDFLLSRTSIEEISKYDVHGMEPVVAPLRLLFVTSLPENIADSSKFIELEKEQEKLIEALGDLISADKVVVEFVDIASIERIQEAVKVGHHHVVHISGHGSHQGKRGVLYLENDDGDEHRVQLEELEELARFFRQYQVRMVLLSACETARAEDEGVAGTFVRMGIPAVLAMRYPITDRTATIFTTHFYRHLCNDQNLPLALFEARNAVRDEEQSRRQKLSLERWPSSEWFTPIIYLNQNIKGFINHQLPPDKLDHFFKKPRTIQEGDRLVASGFIGRRRQIARLHQMIRAGERAIGICGQGGIGKTTLAVRFADNFENQNYQVLQILGKTDVTKILDQLVSLTKADLSPKEVQVLNDKLQSIKSTDTQKLDLLFQNYLSHSKAFILFDNFETNQTFNGRELGSAAKKSLTTTIRSRELADFLNHFIRHRPENLIVFFTSRYRIEPLNINYLDLSEFSFAEAFRLSNQMQELRELDLDTRRRIHEELGGHPYALQKLSLKLGMITDKSWDNPDDIFIKVQKEMVGDFLKLEEQWTSLDSEEKNLLNVAAVFRTMTQLDALSLVTGKSVDKLMANIRDKSLCYLTEDSFYIHRVTSRFALSKIKSNSKVQQLHSEAAAYYNSKKIRTLPDVHEERWHSLKAKQWDKYAILSFGLESRLAIEGLYTNAIKINLEVLDFPIRKEDQIIAYMNLGTNYQFLADYSQAESHFEKALEIARSIDDVKEIAEGLFNIGMNYEQMSKYDLSIEFIEKARQIGEENSDFKLISRCLHQLGINYQYKGDLNVALGYFKKSQQIKQNLGEDNLLATTLFQIGTIFQRLKNYEEALSYYEQANQITSIHGSKMNLGKIFGQVGIIYGDLQKYDKAISDLKTALEIFDEIGASSEFAGCLHSLGAVFLKKRDPNNARNYFQKSIEVCERIGMYNDTYAHCLHGLGNVESLGRLWNDALAYFIKSEQLWKAIKDEYHLAITRLSLGYTHFQAANYSKAVKYLLLAYPLFERLNTKEKDFIINILVELKNHRVRPQRWEKILDKLDVQIPPNLKSL